MAKKLKLYFDTALANDLAKKIVQVEPAFKSKAFVKTLNAELDTHELKARVELFADILYTYFDDYIHGLGALMQILGPENEEETGMFTNFYWLMPMAKYVEKYGMKSFKPSMKAIEEITKRNTGEYAIRPYLDKYPTKTLKQMLKWSKSNNSHVRRLACEGVRPRLPWAAKLKMTVEDPDLILPILENLKDDPSKYVQKSVANCLNDILKDNPKFAKKQMEAWNGKEVSKERKWIIKHALRNLIKSNDAWALRMLKMH